MSVRVTLRGFDEMRRELQRLPVTLAQTTRAEAVAPITQAAAADIRAGYPRRTGALASGVQVEDTSSGVRAAGRVINTHPLAGVFEYGSQARHTALGYARGSMPAGHVFVRRMVRYRRQFWSAVVPIVERTGITVTGSV